MSEPRFTAAEWATAFDDHCDNCMRSHRSPANIRECFARIAAEALPHVDLHVVAGDLINLLYGDASESGQPPEDDFRDD